MKIKYILKLRKMEIGIKINVVIKFNNVNKEKFREMIG